MFYSISPLLKNLKSSPHRFWNMCAFQAHLTLMVWYFPYAPFPTGHCMLHPSLPSLLNKILRSLQGFQSKITSSNLSSWEKFPCLLYNTVLYYIPIVSFY